MEKDDLLVIPGRMESNIKLVVEGNEVLRSQIQSLARKTDERFELVDFKNNVLNEKIDSVTAELKTCRFDTEAHQKRCRVGEE